MVKLKDLLNEALTHNELFTWAQTEKRATWGLAQKISELKSFVKKHGSDKHVRDHLALQKSMREVVDKLTKLQGDIMKHNQDKLLDGK